jgi:ArsR family transcriptional regulator
MDIDKIIKALANPARREILAWLKNPDSEFSPQTYPLNEGVCVGKIFERSDLSQSTVSAHLATLQRAER